MTTALSAVLQALGHTRLPAWLPSQRWSGARGRVVTAAALADAAVLGPRGPVLALYDVDFDHGARERFALALALTTDEREGTLASLTVDGLTVAVDDASDDPAFAAALHRVASAGATVSTLRGGTLAGHGGGPPSACTSVRRLGAEQSNTSWVIDGRHVVKLYRRVHPGVQPDAEMGAYLTAAGFASTARSNGVVVHRAPDGAECTVSVDQAWVPNRGDAWAVTLAALAEVVRGRGDPRTLAASIGTLGRVTGALHAALAAGTDAAFAPAPMGHADREAMIARATDHIDAITRTLESNSTALSPAVREAAARLCSDRRVMTSRMAAAAEALGAVPTIRVHGDYHLGQVLVTDGGFVVIDFEGEPALPLAERRRRSCALRDVAGMVRSLSYAASTAAREAGGRDASARADAWERDARERFVRSWRDAVSSAPVALWPADLPRALALFEADKALYEVVYELRHRPDMVAIPVAGALRALGALAV